MLVFTNTLLVVALGVIAFQDFSERQISWLLLPLVFLLCTLKQFSNCGITETGEALLLNFMFVILQFLLLTLWMSLKNKKWINVIDHYIGLGDLLFFVAVCDFFSPVGFMVYYIGGLLVTLIGFIIYRNLKRDASLQIPLAGGMSLLLIVLILLPETLKNNITPNLFIFNCMS